MMESKRRRFLKIAGVSALASWDHAVLDAFAADGPRGPEYQWPGRTPSRPSTGAWSSIHVNFKRRRLEPIIEACHKIHNIPIREQEPRDQVDLGDRITTTPFPARRTPF
jgi:hypothetical protein